MSESLKSCLVNINISSQAVRLDNISPWKIEHSLNNKILSEVTTLVTVLIDYQQECKLSSSVYKTCDRRLGGVRKKIFFV